MDDNTQMTSAPGASLLPDGTSVITTVHLAMIVIFAVLVVIGIAWGMRLKRRRKAAEREVAEDNDALRDAAPSPAVDAASPAPEPTPRVAPTALAPAPPPMTDAPVVGTPPMSSGPIADEPVATTAPRDAGPAAEAASAAPAADTATTAIPVTTLKGLGPKVAARLAELDITDAGQLAALDDAGAAALDAQLGAFSGRMARDRWIEQARLLTAGDRAGYEAVFGKLS